MARRSSIVLVTGVLLAVVLTVVDAACSGGGGRREAGCAPVLCASATPSAVPPPPPTTSPPAPPPSPSASPHPSASSGAAPTATGPCTSPGPCGFPDASTTGPRIALTPHTIGGLSIHTDGTVISGWDITGSLDIYANNVTVIDSRITSTNWWGINLRSGYQGLRVLHDTITALPGKGPDNGGEDYAVSNMGVSRVEVGWSDISVFGNALSMGQGELHDNYVHDIAPFVNTDGQWAHTDAVISDGGGQGQLVIRHNTLLNPVGIDRGASAAIGLYPDTASVSNTTVDHNWLAGGAYSLYGGGVGASGIVVTDNVFSPQYHPAAGAYGQAAHWNAGGAGNVWSGNRTTDGTEVTAPPP